MVQTVTMHSSVTTSDGCCNMGYLKSISGILKLVQLILGGVVVGLIGYYIEAYMFFNASGGAALFYFTVSISFLIGTFILIVANLFTPGGAGLIPKTLYEIIYHATATLLYAAGCIALIIVINDQTLATHLYNTYMAGGCIGVFVALLYFVSTGYAIYEYRSSSI